MGDSIGKWARFSTLLLGVLCASFGTGCGSDPERDASPEASSSEPLTLLDCTDEDGRPEKLANVETEFYHTDVMAALLEEDAELRGSFGKASVEDCTEARRFMERYEEDKERIDAELLAKHPEAPVEDVQPASEDEPPTTEPPAEEVAKINSGYATSFPFVVKLKTNAGLCSGVLISPRALLTSAHCVPVNGTYLTTIE